MAGFKVIVKKSAFPTFSNEQNEGESKGGAKSGKLKREFSQVKVKIGSHSKEEHEEKRQLWYLVTMFIHCV